VPGETFLHGRGAAWGPSGGGSRGLYSASPNQWYAFPPSPGKSGWNRKTGKGVCFMKVVWVPRKPRVGPQKGGRLCLDDRAPMNRGAISERLNREKAKGRENLQRSILISIKGRRVQRRVQKTQQKTRKPFVERTALGVEPQHLSIPPSKE